MLSTQTGPPEETKPKSSSLIVSLIAHTLAYSVGGTIVIFFLGLLTMLLASLVWVALQVLGVSIYTIPYDLLVVLIPVGIYLSLFIVYLIIGKLIKRIVGLQLRVFFFSLILLALLYMSVSSLFCLIDMLTGCKLSGARVLNMFIAITIFTLPMIASYLYLARSELDFLPKIFKFVVVGSIIPYLAAGFFLGRGMLALRYTKPLLMSDNIESTEMKTVGLAHLGFKIDIPATYQSEDSIAPNQDFGEWISLTPERIVEDNLPFESVYLAHYQPETNRGSIRLDLSQIQQPQHFDTLLDQLNFCGKDYPFTDESEFCPSSNDIIKLENGMQYCEALNIRNQNIIKSDNQVTSEQAGFFERILLRSGSQTIEDRQRVFLVYIPTEPNYCFTLQLSHEPIDTKEKNIQQLAKMILSSLEFNSR